MIGYKKHMDLIQFRLVILDEQDNVIDVLFTSKEYKPSSIFDKPFSEDLYECLMDAHQKYNFDDWENVPPMEFQARRKETDEWIYLSDPIEDFMNT
jgi:hypothetical protein